jgi:hypothetical protein
MGFLRTIAIIVLIYYGIKFLARLLAPFLIKKMADKMTSQFQNPYQKEQETKAEGEVTVEKKPSKTSKFSDTEGEYVDYEEIKD